MTMCWRWRVLLGPWAALLPSTRGPSVPQGFRTQNMVLAESQVFCAFVTPPSGSLCCSQVWGNLSERVCEAAYHSQQVFSAHGNGFSGFLPALEAAEQVSGSLSIRWRGGQGPGCRQLTGRWSLPSAPSRRCRASSRPSTRWTQRSPRPRYWSCDGHSQGRDVAWPSEETDVFPSWRTLPSAGAGAMASCFSPFFADYRLWLCAPRGRRP